MASLNLFRRFDPRLARELKAQRKPILLGLACVAVTSLLTASTIPLIKFSVEAISDAGRLAVDAPLSPAQVQSLARELGKPPAQVSRAIGEAAAGRASEPVLDADERARAADALGVPEEQLKAGLASLTEKPERERQTPREAVQRLGLICLLVVGVFALKYWFTRGQTYFLSYAAARLSTDLRKRMFAKLQRLPVTYFNEKRSGAIQSVLTNDVNVYQNAVGIIRDSIDGPVKAVGAFAMIVALQWQLALVALLFIPVMAAAIQRNARRMKVAQGKVQDDLAGVAAMTQESLQGAKVIKAFAAEERVRDGFGALAERSFQSQIAAARRLASLRPLVEFIGAVALATVLYICGWLAWRGNLQVADIAALVFALDVINQGARALGNVNNTYAQVQAASDRIYREVLDVPDEHLEQPGTQTLSAPNGRIEFENVSFSYPDGTEALRGVSFVLEPGSSLALVGPSGAGKSTIADLIQRFYDPTGGRILFDGVDLRELDTAWLREQIGVVPQQTFLFAGTLADNLRFGAPNATDADLEEAAKAAHADVFIREMDGGMLATIGERGVGISGGQAQRVAIARALVRRPTLLLLDEATSALDAESERHVQAALDEIMRQRTTLFIAHRLTTAARADQILMMSHGQVLERGSHKDLLAANGPYAGMYRAFTSGVLD